MPSAGVMALVLSLAAMSCSGQDLDRISHAFTRDDFAAVYKIMSQVSQAASIHMPISHLVA